MVVGAPPLEALAGAQAQRLNPLDTGRWNMKLARDGVQLSFETAGAGSREFLFIHGLGGDRTHFAPQVAYFSRSARVLNVELRGHGDSDKPVQRYSIEGFADDIHWLCMQQKIDRPVIVGQRRECTPACRAPVLYIEAAHRLAGLDLLARLCPQLVTAKAVGSGHFLSLEVPEQVNPMNS